MRRWAVRFVHWPACCQWRCNPLSTQRPRCGNRILEKGGRREDDVRAWAQCSTDRDAPLSKCRERELTTAPAWLPALTVESPPRELQRVNIVPESIPLHSDSFPHHFILLASHSHHTETTPRCATNTHITRLLCLSLLHRPSSPEAPFSE